MRSAQRSSGAVAGGAFNVALTREHQNQSKDLDPGWLWLALVESHVQTAIANEIAKGQQMTAVEIQNEGRVAGWAVGFGLAGSCFGPIGALVGYGRNRPGPVTDAVRGQFDGWRVALPSHCRASIGTDVLFPSGSNGANRFVPARRAPPPG